MRWLPLLLIAGVLSGCHIETDAPKSGVKPVIEGAPQPVDPKPTVAETKPPRHPDRIYQLEDLKVATIKAGSYEIDAWVMNEDGKRAEGMMFLKPEEVKDTQGMIFVFDGERSKDQGFWMQNTYTPLDIIYIGTDKRVVSIGRGVPMVDKNVPATGPYQYVLELKQGVAKKFGIQPGTQIEIPPEITAEG